ncbi:MAG: hypothetical protein RIR00_2018 [Pseudomonadota bacterium]
MALPPAGFAVEYFRCPACGHCHCPEICSWDLATFADKIYNADYVRVDPEYLEKRPINNADFVANLFPSVTNEVRHLDYGGGNGGMAANLRDFAWDSSSYDPYQQSGGIAGLGRFDLITAFEVFEHVPDPQALLRELRSLLQPDGVILFTTLPSDGLIAVGQPLDWWYAAPRNGHINLFSRASLTHLAQDHGFQLFGLSDNCFLMLDQVPDWARHLFAQG